MLKPFIAKAINRTDLSADEAQEAMNIIMTGQATPAQIGAYLVALRMKGETVDEITGSARAMRANALKVEVADRSVSVYDTAGTGGDGAHTFNISTAAAFVIAGTGRKVAKHGNRAASSQCGSADVLEALGVNLELTPVQVGSSVDEIGIGFMFASKFHPAMKHAGGPRKEIGQRTIFNLLGPLTNPAGADVQIMGIYAPSLTEPLANVLAELGACAALVIHGAGGTDELNSCGINRVSHLKDGAIRTYDLDPADFDLPSRNDCGSARRHAGRISCDDARSIKRKTERRSSRRGSTQRSWRARRRYLAILNPLLQRPVPRLMAAKRSRNLTTLIEFSQSFAQQSAA